MDSIIILITPFVISAVTGLVKMLPPVQSLSDMAQTPAIRAIAAILSLLYVVLTFWFTGSFDNATFGTALVVLGATFMAWLSSLGFVHAFGLVGKKS